MSLTKSATLPAWDPAETTAAIPSLKTHVVIFFTQSQDPNQSYCYSSALFADVLINIPNL